MTKDVNNIKKHQPETTAYDEVPCQSQLFSISEPAHLRAVAHLFGMDAPAVETARILELGAATGSNIIPLAVHYPRAVVVGVDNSLQQVKIGQKVIKKMGLRNLILLCKNIVDIGTSLGTFDYIICHGVYSWVSDEVKAAILRLFGECLSENGIAYLSYNTYPGWKSKEILRDLMRYRTPSDLPLSDKVAYGRGIVQFLAQCNINSETQHLFNKYQERILSAEESYIAHEYFAEHNQADYFYQIIAKAQKNGLTFLSETHYKQHFLPRLPENQAKALKNECSGSRIRYEQFLDFIENKEFRQSLFCRKQQKLNQDGNLYHDTLDKLYIIGRFNYHPQNNAWESTRNGIMFDNTVPALFDELNRRAPSSLYIGAFIHATAHTKAQKEALYRLLAALIVHESVVIRMNPYRLPTLIPPKPQVSAPLRNLAQYILEENDEPVTQPFFSILHTIFTNDPITDPFIIAHLDGRKNIPTIKEIVFQAALKGQFTFIDEHNHTIHDPNTIRLLSNDKVNSTIQALYFHGMLM